MPTASKTRAQKYTPGKQLFCFSFSNRILRSKKLRFDFAPPFSYMSKYKGLAGAPAPLLAGAGIKNKAGENVCATQSPAWWEIQGSNL